MSDHERRCKAIESGLDALPMTKFFYVIANPPPECEWPADGLPHDLCIGVVFDYALPEDDSPYDVGRALVATHYPRAQIGHETHRTDAIADSLIGGMPLVLIVAPRPT